MSEERQLARALVSFPSLSSPPPQRVSWTQQESGARVEEAVWLRCGQKQELWRPRTARGCDQMKTPAGFELGTGARGPLAGAAQVWSLPCLFLPRRPRRLLLLNPCWRRTPCVLGKSHLDMVIKLKSKTVRYLCWNPHQHIIRAFGCSLAHVDIAASTRTRPSFHILTPAKDETEHSVSPANRTTLGPSRQYPA